MAATSPLIVVPDEPQDSDRADVLAALVRYNNEAAGRPSGAQPLAILIKDPETQATIGGLWGRSAYDWLFVEYFAIPDQFRNQDLGSKLLAQAEDIARARGCIGVWLDTYSFQAPGFYAKQGYEIFGTLGDYPKGHSRYYLKKMLA
jgi:GNAT superfamily N-acetyltransferase